LGKFSQIQAVAINNKSTNFGIASFDGRANISNLSKNVNGSFTSVFFYLLRKQLSLSRATNKKKEEILSCIQLIVFHSIQSMTDGL